MAKNSIFDCIKLSNMQKNRAFMRLFCIITRFWCGRKERKRRNSEERASRNANRSIPVINKQKRKPRKRFPFLWCGRQELKTYDDTKKALIFKAFLLLNANVDAKNFWKSYAVATPIE